MPIIYAIDHTQKTVFCVTAKSPTAAKKELKTKTVQAPILGSGKENDCYLMAKNLGYKFSPSMLL